MAAQDCSVMVKAAEQEPSKPKLLLPLAAVARPRPSMPFLARDSFKHEEEPSVGTTSTRSPSPSAFSFGGDTPADENEEKPSPQSKEPSKPTLLLPLAAVAKPRPSLPFLARSGFKNEEAQQGPSVGTTSTRSPSPSPFSFGGDTPSDDSEGEASPQSKAAEKEQTSKPQLMLPIVAVAKPRPTLPFLTRDGFTNEELQEEPSKGTTSTRSTPSPSAAFSFGGGMGEDESEEDMSPKSQDEADDEDADAFGGLNIFGFQRRGEPGRVWFNSPRNSEVQITPYAEVYDMHPRLFDFDAAGEYVLRVNPTPIVCKDRETN